MAGGSILPGGDAKNTREKLTAFETADGIGFVPVLFYEKGGGAKRIRSLLAALDGRSGAHRCAHGGDMTKSG